MNFFLLVQSVSETTIESKDIVDEYTETYYAYKILSDCYEKHNLLQANLDSNQLCVFLYSAQNEACKELPRGIYVDIEVSNWVDRFMRMQFIDFDYDTTTQLCALCPVIDGVQSCEFLKQTESTKLMFRSLTLQTELVIGKLQLGHSDLSNCYDATKGAIRYGQNEIQLELKWNGNCDGATSNCAPDYGSVGLRFYEGNQQSYLLSITSFQQETTTNTHLITFQTNIDGLLQRVMSKVEVQLLRGCANEITKKYVTTISAFGSMHIKQLMQDPVAVLYPNKIVFSHAPIANAAEMEEQMAQLGVASVQLQLRLYNAATDEYYFSFQYDLPTFSFLSDADKDLSCAQTRNEQACNSELQRSLSLAKTGCQMNVFVYYLGADGKVLATASQVVASLRDACWSYVEVIYHSDKYCFNLETSSSTTCPFDNVVDTKITVSFSDQQGTESFYYARSFSIEQQLLCFLCSELSFVSSKKDCQKRIQRFYKSNKQIQITFQQVDEPTNEQSIEVLSAYSADYSKLFELMIYLAIAVGVLAIFIVVFRILKDMGVCKSRKIAEKISKADDLEVLK